jgi:hypothetical protein
MGVRVVGVLLVAGKEKYRQGCQVWSMSCQRKHLSPEETQIPVEFVSDIIIRVGLSTYANACW